LIVLDLATYVQPFLASAARKKAGIFDRASDPKVAQGAIL